MTAAIAPAVPVIGTDLRAPQIDIQWISDIYPLVLSALLLPCGGLLDRFGRRRGMIAGLILLMAGLAASGSTSSLDLLIAGRAIAGGGAALAFPASLATISAVITDDKKSRAVAYWAVSLIVGGGIGMVGGAVAVDLGGWQASLLITSLGVALCLPPVWISIPETRSPDQRRIDGVGCVLSVVGVGLLIIAIIEAPVRGWTSSVTLILIAAGALFLVGFVIQELQASSPLLDLRVLKRPTVGSAAFALFVIFLADFGLIFLIFQYESLIVGMSATLAAVGFLPGLLTLGPLAPISPGIAGRWGLRLVVVCSLLLCAGGCVVGAILLRKDDYVPVALVMLVFWAGMGLGMGPATEAILKGVGERDQGVASALNDLARELGATVGIAVMGSVFNSGYRGAMSDARLHVRGLLRQALSNSPNAALSRRLSPPAKAEVIHAFHVGSTLTLLVGAGVCVIGSGVVAWWLRPPAPVAAGAGLGERDQHPAVTSDLAA